MGRPALTDDAVTAFRQRACTVALDLFADHAEVSLRQLAAAMGVSHTTPYRYFASKEALFMATRALAYTRFAAFLRPRLAAAPDPIARIHVLAQSYFEHAMQRTGEFRLMFQLGQPRPDAWPSEHRAGLDTWRLVEQTAAGAIDAGCLVGDSAELAHLLWASIHGVVSLALAHRLTIGRSGESLIDPMMDAICRAHAPHV